MTKDVVIRIDRTTREKLERMRDTTQLGNLKIKRGKRNEVQELFA